MFTSRGESDAARTLQSVHCIRAHYLHRSSSSPILSIQADIAHPVTPLSTSSRASSFSFTPLSSLFTLNNALVPKMYRYVGCFKWACLAGSEFFLFLTEQVTRQWTVISSVYE